MEIPPFPSLCPDVMILDPNHITNKVILNINPMILNYYKHDKSNPPIE
jgi:hypothetical protein